MPAVVEMEKCDGCGSCKDCCPSDAINIEDDKKAHVVTENCIDCNACQDNCPQQAITMQT